MKKAQVKLIPLRDDDREQFIKDNQRAFKYGAMEEFGFRNDQFEEEGEIISRRTIENCIRKLRFGKRSHRILRPETFTFMSINAGSTLWSTITRIIPIPAAILTRNVKAGKETRKSHEKEK